VPMMLFEDFAADTVLGRHVETIDDAVFEQWHAVFPARTGNPSPGGFAMAFAMRAYLTILPERPPGNIHARQRLTLHRPVARGESVEASLRCVERESRGDRRKVVLAVDARADAQPWFAAEMTILWAR
jgi:acyl dehydratase